MTIRATSVDMEWADGEHTFTLKAPQIEELEAVCQNPETGKPGIGFGAIWLRVMNGNWYASDLRHVIRLGLIGGGMGAVEANRLCKTYVDGAPLHGPIAQMDPNSPLAVAQSILIAAIAGMESEDGGKKTETPSNE